MESEAINETGTETTASRVNRNKVESEVHSFDLGFLDLIVLIETKWNLKCYCSSIGRATDLVLIETKWNLKTEQMAKKILNRMC